MKVLEAMHLQKRAIALLKESCYTVDLKMDEPAKTKEAMRGHEVTEEMAKLLLVRPQPWQFADQVDPESEQLYSLQGSFYDFVDNEEDKRYALWEAEQKAASKGEGTARAIPRRYLAIVYLEQHGTKICPGCNKIMTKCHDVVYGPWCVNEVVTYVKQFPDWAENMVVKKIFIDSYNYALRLDAFRDEGNNVHIN